jgi:chromosome segregation ATPase
MSGLSGMFGLLGAEGDETPAAARNAPQETPAATAAGDEARSGEANAALRNLLVDAKLKLLQFDDTKAFFTTLIEPATQALRTLEQAQAANIDLQRQFNEAAAQCAALHARLHDLEAQHTLAASENDRLTGELELARTQAREAEAAHAALAGEAQPRIDTIAELERQLAALSAEHGDLTQEAERLRVAATASDEKAGAMAADLAAALDKAGLIESELQSLHKSLDDASEQSTGAARKLAESETALAAARARLSQLEAVNEGLHIERDQLRAALDANGIKHDGQQSRMQMQIDAVRARAAATEKLLAEARQQLAQRGEDVRTTGQRQVESNYARERAEKRIAAMETELQALRAELASAKKDRDRLVESTNVAAAALKLRDAQVERAEETARKAAERSARLHAAAREGTTAFKTKTDELTSALERERHAHQATADALEATRTERDQLQSHLLELQLELNRRAVSNDTEVDFPSRGANAA